MPVNSFSNKEWDNYLSLLSLIMIPATKPDTARLYKDEAIRKALPLLTDNMFLGSFTTENLAPLQRENEVREFNDGLDNTLQVADKRTRELLAYAVIHKHPAIADIVANAIPWQSSPNLRGCLLRDIRNYFYAKDMSSFLKSIKILLKHFPDAFKNSEPLAFLEYHILSPWICKIPAQLLSFAAASFLPLAAANLWDPSVWEQALLDNIDKIDESAKLSLVDIYLLQGRIDDAQKLLEYLKGDARGLREAWICFMQSKNDEAIEIYNEILERIRKNPGQENAYFKSTSGIFFIFALMKKGGKYSEKAAKLAYDAINTPFLKNAYQDLAQMLGKIVIPSADDAKTTTPLADFFSFFCNLANEKLGALQMRELTERFREPLDSYTWLRKEMAAATSGFYGDSSDQSSIITSCFSLRPPWQRAIDKLNEILRKPRDNGEFRLAWLCTYDENDRACPVKIRPIEQRLTKKMHWNKGRNFPLAKYLDMQTMPQYLSNQDKVICNILGQEYDRSFSAEVRDAQGNFRLLPAVQALPGHPCLYWDGANPLPFKCKAEKPILAIREEEDQLVFGIYPQFNGNPYNFVTEKDAQNDLIIYNFSDMHKEILQEIGTSFHAPKSIASDSALIIRPLAEAFRVLSYAKLDLLNIKPQKTELTPHLRLIPGDDTMRVEMLMQPFTSTPDYYRPGSGPRELLTMENNTLERYVRDFEAEEEQANIVILLCEVLNECNACGQWSWELNSLEQCCQFTLALHNISKQVQVHWPDNHKLRISRRITLKDMSVKCKSTSDWFSLDGTIKVDDGLLVSMKEIISASRKQHGNFLQLSDGQIIALADSFRKRLDDFAAVTYEDEDTGMLRFNNFALPFMEKLLEDCTTDEERLTWTEKANKIRKAMSMQPDLPSALKATLRPYQKDGFTWLYRLDAWHAGACLADDMGLGKTIQTIAFILSKAGEGPVLIVAPTSVCANWIQEINRFAPSLETFSFGGLKRLRILQNMGPRKVLIASYGLLQSEAEEFDKVEWRIAVLDEAQAIKNHNTKRSRAAIKLNAKFRIVTTGTPMENNLNELWSIFNFINPGLLGTHATFQEQFAIPIEKNNDKETLQRLTTIVSPFILRRRKSQVLTDLPPKTEIQLHVNMSDEEWAFYEALRSQLIDEIRGYANDGDHVHIRVIAAITRLRQAACNPRLIIPDSPIASSKMNTFTELLEELISGGHKILVFSQFVKHLELIRPEIEDRGIRYQYLDGATPIPERMAAVKAFQAGEGDVFLISLKAGGLGLNLTAADYVIHLDPWWNPAVEDQASDRAYRIGQDKPVTIYRLITQNTIEDEILKLHQSKRDLADNLLAGTDTLDKVGIDELMRLLTTATKRESIQ